MGGTNPFAEALAGRLHAGADDRLRTLREFCDGIEEATARQASARLLRGYATGLGQEWRIMVGAADETSPEYILLRAHLDPDGHTTLLDLYDDEPAALADNGELSTALVEFAKSEACRVVLSQLMARPT